jgi:SAM-dependent methyltransferase
MIGAFPDAALHGLDMSAAMLADVRKRFGHRVAVVRGDIERLPYRDATFDVIATCWTLYFMNDIDAALEEIKRCVKPAGRVVAATVAADHMHEFDDLVAEAVLEALGRDRDPDISVRFNVENGEAYMRRHFDDVDLREWRGEMRLPDVATTMVLWRGYGPQLQDPAEDAAARKGFGRLVQSVIERDGEFYVTRHDGVFVARV